MVNTYTVSNAAKRLNCSKATIARAITDGRFHDCFMQAGYHGRPAWMIPSDQVEDWVTRGGFVQPEMKGGVTGTLLTQKQAEQIRHDMVKAKQEEEIAAGVRSFVHDVEKKANEAFSKSPDGVLTAADVKRMIFDPEAGKYVPVLDLLSEEDRKPIPEPASAKPMNEFEKRAVRRVAGQKYVKVLDRTTKEKLEEIKMENVRNKEILKNFAEETSVIPANPSPVVRTDSGFSVTIPAEIVEDMIKKQIRSEFADAVRQLRDVMDQLNEKLKKLEEVVA